MLSARSSGSSPSSVRRRLACRSSLPVETRGSRAGPRHCTRLFGSQALMLVGVASSLGVRRRPVRSLYVCRLPVVRHLSDSYSIRGRCLRRTPSVRRPAFPLPDRRSMTSSTRHTIPAAFSARSPPSASWCPPLPVKHVPSTPVRLSFPVSATSRSRRFLSSGDRFLCGCRHQWKRSAGAVFTCRPPGWGVVVVC